MRRAAAVWLLLFAVYASTLGIEAIAPDREYAGVEPHYLLTARSLVDDRGPDLRDEYDARAYREFVPSLRPDGSLTDGRVNEPHGVGFPLLIAPAYAIGG